MHRKLAYAIVNSGLLVMVLVLLAGPLLMGQLLSTSQSGALGATSVRSTQASSSSMAQPDFLVTPNSADFKNFAQFNAQPMASTHFYQTSVAFTAFAGQLAAYNGLLSVTNTTTKQLRLAVEVGTLSGVLPQSRIYLTLTGLDKTDSALITQPAEVGATNLVVSQIQNFTSGSVAVGGQAVTASRQSVSSLALGQPLSQRVAVGDKIYYGPAFFAGAAQPVLSSTQIVTLAAGQKAAVNLSVATDAGAPATLQAELPLTIVEK